MKRRSSSLLLRVMCALMRHPPSTYGDREMEDPIIEVISNPPTGTKITVGVSCLCGRKIVPFRAAPLRGDRE